MSMTKTVPDGLKARECERIKLCEPPPVSYVPVRDEVQDEVARMRHGDQNNHRKRYYVELSRLEKKTGPAKVF